MIDTSVTVQSRDGTPVQIYVNRIDELCDEYINSLNLPDEEICKAHVFMGTLKFIYVNMFKPNSTMPHNSNSILVNADADTIGDVWDRFAALAYRFHVAPTILKFATMTGLDRATIERWLKGETRNSSSAYCRTARKMYQEAECALESKAIDQSQIGAIFGLKSCFRWRETSPVLPEEIQPERPRDSIEEIKARHAHAQKPELPDLGGYDDVDTDV